MNPTYRGYCIISDCGKFILDHFANRFISLEKFYKQLKEYPWVIEEFIFRNKELAEEDISWIEGCKNDTSYGVLSLRATRCRRAIEKGLNISYFNMEMQIEIGKEYDF